MKPSQVEDAWAVAHGLALALETLAPHLAPAIRDALDGRRPPAKVRAMIDYLVETLSSACGEKPPAD